MGEEMLSTISPPTIHRFCRSISSNRREAAVISTALRGVVIVLNLLPVEADAIASVITIMSICYTHYIALQGAFTERGPSSAVVAPGLLYLTHYPTR